ncbi:hypothetical protein [Leucobacter sp. M11]|uniref:hypothetical protein n=1 Tax=Leucobacter sp. M11 TaxID=2993565 RepID=UPI002D7F7147|nr:hypothetical protein [Leucobacter sp. M11]MEB4616111.1 hypothetical protein [Leucobacter sp. M11]
MNAASTPDRSDVLLIGASGAVGSTILDRLRGAGLRVTPAGRTRPEGGVSLNLGPEASAADLARLGEAAARHRLVLNASGAEHPALAAHLGGAQLLDISASAAYLAALAAAPATRTGAALVLGVGLAPGLTTALARALDTRPGDEIDLGIMLGSGERHGPAAVDWTAGLIGADLADAAEGGRVQNLRERRAFAEGDARGRGGAAGPRGGTRGYLRADFPDHTLLRMAPGADPGLRVRSYLALSSRAMTGSLGVLARLPRLAGLLRVVPPLGDERWAVTAVNRRTGETLRATGVNQSRATAELTAATALAALGRGAVPGVTLGGDVLNLAGAARVPGVRLEGRVPGERGAAARA